MVWEPLISNFFLFWGWGGRVSTESKQMQKVTEEEETRLGLVFKSDRYMTKKQSSDNACGNAY